MVFLCFNYLHSIWSFGLKVHHLQIRVVYFGPNCVILDTFYLMSFTFTCLVSQQTVFNAQNAVYPTPPPPLYILTPAALGIKCWKCSCSPPHAKSWLRTCVLHISHGFLGLDVSCGSINFILGSNFIFLCFKLVHYHTPRQRKIKF